MLKLTRNSSSGHCEIYDDREDGSRLVGRFEPLLWDFPGSKTILTLRGDKYLLYREGLLSGDFILEEVAGAQLARAKKQSAFRRRFMVTHDAKTYTLRPPALLGDGFTVVEQSTEVGSILPKGLLVWEAEIDLPDDLPTPVQLFMVWLTDLWRQSDAVSM